MSENQQDLVVYVLARSDLPSLNPGKLAAQVHHAGVQMTSKYQFHVMVQEYISHGVAQGADNFNTTIVLSATHDEIVDTMKAAGGKLHSTIIYDIVVDPTYPFVVDEEISRFITQNALIKIVKVLDNGKVLMVRPELTCAWFLIDRNNSDTRELFDKFNLYP